MDQDNSIELTGRDLSIEQIVSCVADSGRRVRVSAGSLDAIASGHAFLTSAATERLIYGVNTGFGPMASCVLGRNQLVELQYNLVRSHAAGIGDPIDPAFVLASMMVRLNTLAHGVSGVSCALVRTLEAFINNRIIPVIPEHGAVGASGDLVQLAHLALALIGEGEVFFGHRRARTADVLSGLGIRPHRLGPKEGLALINGTAVMAGSAAVLCHDAERLTDLAIRNAALCLEIVRAFDDGICEELHDLRPHPGQRYVAARLRDCLASSRLLRKREAALAGHTIEDEGRRLDSAVQEVYSIRCVPQILGPVHDAVQTARARVETELNAVTDNPVVLWKQRKFVHGGNFHGDYIASSLDQLKSGIVKLTMLSERRINFCLNAAINRMLPPFLNLRTPGFNLGLQGMQFVATSTTAQSQTLAYPHHLHSISTNGDNQDVVSMGTDAALLVKKVIDNAFVVLTLEAVTLAQAVDCLGVAGELSVASRALYEDVRTDLPPVTDDRPLYSEVGALCQRLRRVVAQELAARGTTA